MKLSGQRPKTTPLLIATGILILTLLAGMVLVRASSPYRRYVSPPLPGGARYTFLYPRHLRAIHEEYGSKDDDPHNTTIDNYRLPTDKLTVTDRLSDALAALLLRAPGGRPIVDETIFCVVGHASPEADGRIRDSRVVRHESVANSAIQTLQVVDARTGWTIIVSYVDPTRSPGFDRDSALLSRSFRILAPGEEPPVGESADGR